MPPLASFIETKAKAEGLDIRQVTEQPEKQFGEYRRRHVRARFAGVSLRPVMRLLANMQTGNLPLAFERIQVEHYQSGDRYNVQIGVYAFDREAKKPKKPAGNAKKGG